jgi:hypothetical protein
VNLIALASAGLPPFGLGVYVRNTVEGLPNVRSYFVFAARADRLEQARALQDRGKQVWFWIGPEAVKHDNWQRGLDRLLESVAAVRGEGILVDPERNRNTGGWMVPNARDEMARFGEACGRAAAETRVGMTSYYAHPGVREFAAAAGDRVWGTPQLYGHVETNPAEWLRQFRGWQSYFGSTRVIPSISGWVTHPSGATGGQQTAEGYQRYLDNCPKASGAIAFLGAGRTPAHVVRALEAYSPGGNPVSTFLMWCAAAIGRPAGAATLGILLAILVFVAGAVSYAV